MAEVTRVPLQKISRGSIVMLFVGIVLGLLIAAGFAWLTAPKGVSVDVVRAGTGEHPGEGDVVFVHYTLKLADGTVVEESQPLNLPVQGVLPEGTPLPLENMVPGFKEAAFQMQRGGKYTVEIPADKAYGETGNINPQTGEGVPPNADLTFDIELVDFMPMAEVERRFAQMQQMMQQQVPAEGAEGGAAPAPVPPAGQ